MSKQTFSIELTPELQAMLERRAKLYSDDCDQEDSAAWLQETEDLNRKIATYTEIYYGVAKTQGLII